LGAGCINVAQHKDLGVEGCCDQGNERYGSIQGELRDLKIPENFMELVQRGFVNGEGNTATCEGCRAHLIIMLHKIPGRSPCSVETVAREGAWLGWARGCRMGNAKNSV